MAVNRLYNPRVQFVDSNGNPANNYRLFFYAAGTSTKQNTYNSSAGTTANSNPITLNSLGQPAVEIWATAGLRYKIGLAAPGSDDPPSTFIWTEDNCSGDGTQTVDSIETLRTYSSGDYVYVAGYHAGTLVGGGWFAWSASSTAAENGGTVIVPNSNPASGRWLRVTEENGFTPQDFGAVADGTSHPLSAYFATLADAQAVYPLVTSLTQEIDEAAAITASAAAAGEQLTWPAGNYIFAESATLGSTVTNILHAGAVISPASTKTVTFAGIAIKLGIDSPAAGAGTVTFSGGLLRYDGAASNGSVTQKLGSPASTAAKGRTYWDGANAFYHTNNMYYNSGWVRDVTTYGASKIGLGSQTSSDTWGSFNVWTMNSTVAWNNAAGQSWSTDGIPLVTWGGTVGEILQVNLPSSSGSAIGQLQVKGWQNSGGGAVSYDLLVTDGNGNMTMDMPAGKQRLFKVGGTNKAWIPFTDGKIYFGDDIYPSTDSALTLGKDTTNRFLNIFTYRVRMTPVTVSQLPSASTAGAGTRAFVSDANATTFASIVAGSGSNNVPVYSDGTNWRIG